MLAHLFFSGIGLKYGVQGQGSVDVNFEIVPPIKMPELLPEHEDAAGYLVAEPLGTKAIAAENAELQFLSSELWEDHPCCVVTMQQSFIENYPDAVYEFTEMLVHAGKLIDSKPDLAAEIAVKFLDPKGKLGLKVPILYNVLTEPKGIKTNNLYPVVEDLDRIQRYMKKNLGIGTIIDVNKFADLRFAQKACPESDQLSKSVFKPEKDDNIFQKLLYGIVGDKGQRSKALLSKEGKYLNFLLDNQMYGVNILTVKEIIPIREIRSLPMTDDNYKGVIVLRDNTIPVIDLRLSLGMNSIEYNDRSVIIILETEGRGIAQYIGVIVDSVSEVRQIEAKDIEKPTSSGVSTLQNYIIGMAKKGETVETLLDIEMLLQQKAGEYIQQVA
jgi:chemotaxis signal transduction protein